MTKGLHGLQSFGHLARVPAGEPLPHICTVSQPVKSEEVCGPGRLTAGLASAGLSTAQLCSAFFPESRGLACPVQPPDIVKWHLVCWWCRNIPLPDCSQPGWSQGHDPEMNRVVWRVPWASRIWDGSALTLSQWNVGRVRCCWAQFLKDRRGPVAWRRKCKGATVEIR